jgi:uncharacterized protein (TIGR00369 family)
MTFEEIRASADKCFGCGPGNEIGLKLKFHEVEKGVVQTKTILLPPYQGYASIVHGGIVSTLLDEAMAYAALYSSDPGHVATAWMEVRFSKPVPIGKELTLIGRITQKKRNILETEGEIRSIDGDVLASSAGKYVWKKIG